MGNGSSKYSSRAYDYRPFTGPVIPPASQMTNATSYASGSTPMSYDMPRRKKRKWYTFGTGIDRHRGQDVWYSSYVSPRGQQPPTPNPYGAYQRPPDSQRGPSMPVPMTAQYGSLHIPDGYIPSSDNQPVIPQEVITPITEPDDWRRPVQPHQQHQRRPSQGHYRGPSQPVIPINPSVVMPQPFSQPTSSMESSSFSSPPFKPFKPLPVIARARPPTPPPKLLDLPPFRETLPYLAQPSMAMRTEAREIINNKAKTDVQRAHEEWRRQDAERERTIREKKEERDRLISGASTIRAPAVQTVTTLVVDPTTVQRQAPPPLPQKEKKRSLWAKLFKSRKPDQKKQQPVMQQTVQTNGPVVLPLDAQHVLPSIPGVPGVVLHMSETSSGSSSSNTLYNPGRGHKTPGGYSHQTPGGYSHQTPGGRSHHTPGRQTPGPSHHTPGPSHQTPGPSHHTPGPSHQTPGPSYQTPGPIHQTPGPTHRTPGSTLLSPSRSSHDHGGRSPAQIYQPTPTPAVIPSTPGSRYGGGMPNPVHVGQQVGMPSPYLYHGDRSTTPEVSPPENAAFFSIPNPVHIQG